MEQMKGVLQAESLHSEGNGYFESLCPPEGELRLMMSGRCGIYLCLEDIRLTDEKKTAYVPRYTCETVLAPFEKAGYRLLFYDQDLNLRSSFDPAVLDDISVISLCGYYGFCEYDRDFVGLCRERGITVFEDMTHSLFSEDGLDPLWDYAAGSFRKWMTVPCGGFAMKRQGRFAVSSLPPHPRHLELRRRYAAGEDVFWEGEMLLRQIFDLYEGDRASEALMRQTNLRELRARRRENFSVLLAGLPEEPAGFRPVFPALTEAAVPSHFPMYADNREEFQAFLRERGIRSTVFWPQGPLVELTGQEPAAYIYSHIVSIPCGQDKSREDMVRAARVLAAYSDFMRRTQ